MRSSNFTSGQRRVLMVMIVLVVAVFAALAGFIITSLRDQQSPPPVTDEPSILDVPTVASMTVTPSPTPVPTTEQLADGITSRVQAARLLDQIERQVETVRTLSPRAEVPLNFLSEREMSSLLRRLYRQRDPEAILLPYTALGLLPDASVSIHQRRHGQLGIGSPGTSRCSFQIKVLILQGTTVGVRQNQNTIVSVDL